MGMWCPGLMWYKDKDSPPQFHNKLKIHRPREEFWSIFLNFMTCLGWNVILNAQLKSINIRRNLLPVGKGGVQCTSNGIIREVAQSLRVCIFKSWGLSFKPWKEMTQLPWQHWETLTNVFHYVCEYECLCMSVCLGVMGKSRETKTQINDLIN